MKNKFLSLVGLAAIALTSGCKNSEYYTASDFASTPKIDAHVHANADLGAMMDAANKFGFEVLSINVDYPDFPPLEEQAAISHSFHEKHPANFHFATTFTMAGFGEPTFNKKTINSIDSAITQGAIAVKVWKNVGMVETDNSGERVFIDDQRFGTITSHIKANKLPFIAHQGEPKNCWLPLEEMTTDNDRAYFSNHPEYYMYLHPEEPSYQELMDARDRFVEANPDLNFIGAHMASLEWSTDELAKFLDRFPNATVDLAARMSQIQAQSFQDHDKVREFFIKYQDRLLYGSDLTETPPSPDQRTQNPPTDPSQNFIETAEMVWRSDWQYLATSTPQMIDAIGENVIGLKLPRSVIDKVYSQNAAKVFNLNSKQHPSPQPKSSE